MAIAGRVAIVPKGDWSADATYKRLDAVTYNNTLYFAKKDVPAGIATSNTEYWSKSIVGGAGGVATADEAGVVKPADGLTVAEDGTLKVNIDGTTLTMDQVNNVIKLADTLKDAINGAFPAANVANNQITTVEGFALDARQANPNIDGSLAKQISDLNGSKANYRNNLPCYEFRRASFEGITDDGFENIKALYRFDHKFFDLGTVIHIEKRTKGLGYDTFFIGSTGIYYFRILCISYYEEPYSAIYDMNEGWSEKKYLTS